MEADKVWDMFLADRSIALASIPWVADVISPTAQTLGYYEYPHSEGQSELIPAWIFTADFYDGGQLLAEGVSVYLPAAAEFLPPEVAIESPTAGAEFNAYAAVNLSGSVEQYGKAPYSYEWHSSHDGFLGSGEAISVALSAAIKEGGVVSHTISLQVTDANGQMGSDSTMVLVRPTMFLHLVLKGG